MAAINALAGGCVRFANHAQPPMARKAMRTWTVLLCASLAEGAFMSSTLIWTVLPSAIRRLRDRYRIGLLAGIAHPSAPSGSAFAIFAVAITQTDWRASLARPAATQTALLQPDKLRDVARSL